MSTITLPNQSVCPPRSPLTLINARLPGQPGLYQLSLDPQGILQPIQEMESADPEAIPLAALDLAGDWVSLGGVDLQINGALGLAFPELNPGNADQLPQICQFLWEQGINGFLPTLVTTSVANIQQALAVFAEFQMQGGSQILGVHLEGPFLNPEKRGAHPSESLLPLTLEQVKRVLGDYSSLVKVMTLAPELDPTRTVIPYLRSLGITVSLGHSLATAAEAQQAFDLGATMVTHAFNAMPALHHREPGLLGAAIIHPDVHCGLIADGQHVVPTMMEILLRASHYEQGIFLVSDALAPLGLPDGLYPWDSRQIEVNSGTARLTNGTLSGTTLPLLVGVQNLVHWGICDPDRAIAMATTSPRKAIGLPELGVGQPVSLLRWRYDAPHQTLVWERLRSPL
jgi:N-acetylglucosamine-6-phosphate deacetylase